MSDKDGSNNIHFIDKAIDDCIENNILRDELTNNRQEIRDILFWEYQEELRLKAVSREERFARLAKKLYDDKREEDFVRAVEDIDYREKLCKEYGIEELSYNMFGQAYYKVG